MSETQTKELIREGAYVAEVDVTLIDTGHEWSPYISAADTRKLDEVRLALRKGDLKTAAKLSTVYELKPIAAAE
jgi:hypothetical protein